VALIAPCERNLPLAKAQDPIGSWRDTRRCARAPGRCRGKPVQSIDSAFSSPASTPTDQPSETMWWMVIKGACCFVLQMDEPPADQGADPGPPDFDSDLPF